MRSTLGRGAGLVLKRAFDIGVALTLLVLFSPIVAVVALAVRLRMGSPVFFRQNRPGVDGQAFGMIKFRTMVEEAAGDDLSNDYARITPLGQTLRRFGLDELPELVNVLKGDMSLVGPRPLLMEYLPKYTEEQARRHEMRPGVTGLAQVNGRQGLLYSRKLEMDVWYVDHWSLWLDLKILAKTVGAVFGASGKPIEDLTEFDDIGLMDNTDKDDGE